MNLVYIEYLDRVQQSKVNSICDSHWQNVQETLQDRKVAICKVDALKSYVFSSTKL